MSDRDRPDDDMAQVAWLYAAGALEGAAAAEFEQRLADSQTARGALCAAVRKSQALSGGPEPLPHPGYRDRVRQRLEGIVLPRRESSRSRRGWRVAAWSLASAAAAAMVVLVIGRTLRSLPDVAAQLPAVAQQAPQVDDLQCNDGDEWPEFATGQHLAQAVDEENARKMRAEDRRMVPFEERAARLRGAPVYRQ
jgi:anti-sigma-K factor RskA